MYVDDKAKIGGLWTAYWMLSRWSYNTKLRQRREFRCFMSAFGFPLSSHHSRRCVRCLCYGIQTRSQRGACVDQALLIYRCTSPAPLKLKINVFFLCYYCVCMFILKKRITSKEKIKKDFKREFMNLLRGYVKM